MAAKPNIARNAVWNWSGMAVTMLVGFLVAPYLVRKLGQTTYGLWILIASFTSYFYLLDLGVRGSVGRNVAHHRAKNDQFGVNAVLTTALTFLSLAGLVALIGTVLLTFVFFRIFDVPPEQVYAARVALILVGVNLALWLPLNVFDATLWANQRFDVINAVDIGAAIARGVLTVYLVGRGGGLVALAALNLISLAGAQAIKGFASFRIDPSLRVGRRYYDKAVSRTVFGFGLWYFLMSIAAIVNKQVAPLIIGAFGAVGLVTPFSVAQRLVSYGRDFVSSGAGVLTPLAIRLDAAGDEQRQRALMVNGGRYSTALALFFLYVFLFLGKPVIALWMGRDLAWSSSLLAILAAGELLPMSQWASNSVILGKGRHRAVAIMNLLDNAIAIPLAIWLIRPYGLAGVCVAFAVPGALCRGVAQLVYACRLVDMPLWRYGAAVVAPVALATAVPAAALAAAARWVAPESWPALFLVCGGYGALYLACCAPLIGVERIRSRLPFARRTAAHPPAAVAAAGQ